MINENPISILSYEGENMANVTLIGEKQAIVGNEFVYCGPLNECRDCKVKTVCFNLKEGRKYRIVHVRDMHHECKIHEAGVKAVEYEELPIDFVIDKKLAIEGAIVEVTRNQCNVIGCKYYEVCTSNALSESAKYNIVSCGESFKCDMDKSLTVVKLTEA